MDRKNINRGFRIPELSKYCACFLQRISSLLYQLQVRLRRKQLTADDYERLDQLHYKVENALLKLIESLQKKQTGKKWKDNFHSK